MAYINFVFPGSLASIPPPTSQPPPSPTIGIDTTKLATQLPLVSDIVFSSLPSATTISGPLGNFPAELKSMLLGHMDVASITKMRCVSKVWRATVERDPLFRKITAASNFPLLRLLVATNLTTHLTAATFLTAASADNHACRTCGTQAELFDVLHLDNTCRRCFATFDKPMASLARVRKACGLSEKKIRALVPVMDTIPGAWGSCTAGRRERRQHIMRMEDAAVVVGQKAVWSCAVPKGPCLKQMVVVVTQSVGL